MQIISMMVEYLATGVDCILVLWFMTSYFGAKRKIRYWEYLGWFAAFFVIGQYMSVFYDLQTIMMIGCVFLYAMLYLKGKWIIKLIGDLGIYILVALINVATIQSVSIISDAPVESLLIPGTILRILVLCISKATLLVVIYFTEKSIDKKQYLKKEETIFMIVLYLMFFGVATISVQMIATLEMNQVQQIRFLILNLLLFLTNIFLFFMIKRMNDQNRYELENGILKVQLEEQEKQIYNTQKLYQDAKKLRHDMKHYFSTYLQLLKDGESAAVIEDMQNIIQTKLETPNIFYMEEKMINAVLNQKALLCKEYEIPLEVQITGNHRWKNESNIAILLSNLLDNAIEAEIRQEKKKEIWIQIYDYKKQVNIIVKNYIEESVLQSNPELKTTKKDKKGHGIGIGSIKEIVRQEEGAIDIFEEGHYFNVHILI